MVKYPEVTPNVRAAAIVAPPRKFFLARPDVERFEEDHSKNYSLTQTTPLSDAGITLL